MKPKRIFTRSLLRFLGEAIDLMNEHQKSMVAAKSDHAFLVEQGNPS